MNRIKSAVDSTLARHGGLSYIEIPAKDPVQAATFYAAVFGWVIGGEKDNPKFADAQGMLIGRWIQGRPIARDPGMLPYFYVVSVDEAIERVKSSGGEVLTAPYPEGNLRVAIIRDPAGNALGIWQAVT